MDDLYPIRYQCACCGQENETFVDPAGGSKQTYTEDCAVCCRPNVLHVQIDHDGNVDLNVEFEG